MLQKTTILFTMIMRNLCPNVAELCREEWKDGSDSVHFLYNLSSLENGLFDIIMPEPLYNAIFAKF